MKTCERCGQPVEKFWVFFRICDSCGKAQCAKGNHTWEPAALGPGAAIFDCLFCDATSSGSLDPLKQMGFVEVKNKE